MVKRVYESDNFYHMVLKNNSSSTKAPTTVDEGGESDDQPPNHEFKLKKVDLYLERKEKENSKQDSCENLFKFMNINEPDEKEQELNKAIENIISNEETVDGSRNDVLNAYINPEERDVTNLKLL